MNKDTATTTIAVSELQQQQQQTTIQDSMKAFDESLRKHKLQLLSKESSEATTACMQSSSSSIQLDLDSNNIDSNNECNDSFFKNKNNKSRRSLLNLNKFTSARSFVSDNSSNKCNNNNNNVDNDNSNNNNFNNSISSLSSCGGKKGRHSYDNGGGVLDNSGRINNGNNTTTTARLMDELKPTSIIPIEESHGDHFARLKLAFGRNIFASRASSGEQQQHDDDQPKRKSDEINAHKIFVREERKSRLSTYQTSKFVDVDELRTLFFQNNETTTTKTDDDEIINQNETKQNKKKQVQFIDVQIREYPMIVGVNPSCSGGPPVTIDWVYVNEIEFDFDKYEKARFGNRRKQDKMKMDKVHRQNLLRQLGFTMSQQLIGTKEANIVRNRRRKTNSEIMNDQFNERMEMMTERLLNVVSFGYKNRKGKQYLKKCYYDQNNNNSDHDDDLDDNCSIKSLSWMTLTKNALSSKKKNKQQRLRFASSLKRFKKIKGRSNNNDVSETGINDDDISTSSISISAHTL